MRPIVVRQERTGLHMADAVSRLTSGKTIGVFVCQSGLGAETAKVAVAQAHSESVPLPVMPGGYARRLAHVAGNFNTARSMRDVTKSAEPLNDAREIGNVMRRAFSRLRNGRGGRAGSRSC